MNETYKFYSVTIYIDEETGENIDKYNIGITHQKTHLIDERCDTDNETYTKKITRIIGCKRIPFIQLKLSL